MVPVIDAIARARRFAIRKPLCGQRALERFPWRANGAHPEAAEKLPFNIGRLGERQSQSLVGTGDLFAEVALFGRRERQILPPGRKGSAAARPSQPGRQNKPLKYLDIFCEPGWPGLC
jgi:hypothetical protein